MTEIINRRITALILALLMTIGMMPVVTLTAHAEEGAAISLVAAETYTFGAATEGYGTQAGYQAWVYSTGSEGTGALTVNLGGRDPLAFVLSDTNISSIASGEKTYFDVTPAPGLSEGAYSATVTVSGSNVTSKSFTVNFTVNAGGSEYTATIHTNLNGLPQDVTGVVALQLGDSSITVPKTGTGVYETSAPNGDYTIMIGDVSTGRHLVVSGEDKSVTLDYYTVNFSASYEGTATGVSVGASVDGVSIASGDKVLATKSVKITATGTGANTYTYLWSGQGTNDETTATLNITINNAVNAACVVTGSGTPPSSPDYEIGNIGYNWTGSAQNVVLSGANDTLTINKAPSAAVTIEVQSAAGSNVTINGKSIVCKDTKMVVSNAITLNLTNFDITAPTGNLEYTDLYTGLLINDTTTINVTGTCNITGNAHSSKQWVGYGIASQQDNSLRITGTGTLNATGGSANTGNGKEGIFVMGVTSGAKLIIENGVTVNAKGGDSPNNPGGGGISAGWGDILIDHATVSAIGGAATGTSGSGGAGIQASFLSSGKGGNITITDSTVTATGGTSKNSSGGVGIYTFCDLSISGGKVIATGGNGFTNGAHGIFSYYGAITVSGGADLAAVGGDGGTGTNDVGGVGVRAYGGADSTCSAPGIVTISNTAGKVYIRGGESTAAKRASVMGKGVYIGTGNIGPVTMESGTPRLIKNTATGDNLYLVNVSTSPAEAAEIQCEVNGMLGGSYTYRAVATADGTACVWLPEGEQTLSAAGYHASGLTVATSDASNAVTLSKPDVVTAHDSNELRTYLAAVNVTTIDLVSGTTYTLDGTTVTRDLTINGNGAVINVGIGIDDTIIKREDNSVTGKVFLAVQNGSLTIKDVTLRDISTRILAAINVKTNGSLLLDGVTFEGFFANLSTDAYPDLPNMQGNYNNFGVHAEPGAVSTTVKNCTFGSSNTFRNAVAIRKGTAVIQDNIFVGTATPDRQNQTDGFEYAVYLYGGICTVTGNDISGYDSILKPLGYHSSGICTCPFYSLTATITGNKLHDNARGIDGVGAWHTYSDPTDVKINGTVLKDSEGAFTIGQALKADNTFAGNVDGNVAVILDQNDNYIDTLTGIEYGPPAYFEPLLKVDSTNSVSATLSFDSGIWAQAMVRNAKSILIQVSADNGVTWSAASITDTIDASTATATVTLAAGKTYLLRSVMMITANTRPFGSEDNVSADITCYSNTVSATISSGGSSGHSGGPAPAAVPGGVAVIVNGESKTAGTAQTATGTDGRTTTTITVDSAKLESILASTERGATVIIPVAGNPDTAAGVLTGEMVKGMENREATLIIKTDSATYMLPAAEINITAISEQLGTKVALKDIKVEVSISEPSSQMSKAVESAAKNGGFTPVLAAVDYTVTCSYGGRTVNVSSYNAYVERTVAIPDGVDPSKITTGIVVKPDGTTYHVPTRVTVIDGKYYAVINSLTNSTYSVIWNPIEFSDVQNHWAKASVNNMGSRMVVDGVGDGNFEPDRDMTRAEFAAVMIRALGLEPGSGTGGFSDIPSAKWYSGSVQTAAAYGIIKGYSDAAFGPDDKITREQAMTMIARAMKLTGLSAGLTAGESNDLLGAYKDRSSLSSFAGDSAAECIKTGVVSGRGSSQLAPKAYVTRAEVAAMIERLLQKSNLI